MDNDPADASTRSRKLLRLVLGGVVVGGGGVAMAVGEDGCWPRGGCLSCSRFHLQTFLLPQNAPGEGSGRAQRSATDQPEALLSSSH